MGAGVAMTTAIDASHMISMKYPDLSNDHKQRESTPQCSDLLNDYERRESSPQPPPPRPPQQRSCERRLFVSHFDYLKLDEMVDCEGDEDLLANLYMDEDVHDVVSVPPLRPETLSSVLLHVRKTPRKHGKRAPQFHNTAGLKHKFLRLCGAPRSIFSVEYMSLPG